MSSQTIARSSGCPVHSAGLGQCPVGADVFDPFQPAYLEDPADYVRWAREQQPVFFSESLGYWVVTRYEDVKAVFRDHVNYSPSNALEKVTPFGPQAQAVLSSYGYAMDRTMVNEDEPAHMARRRLLLEPFTPEAVRHHEPMVRRLVRAYVDRFIDDGRADLVDQMLWEVPLTIALHFLGVDEEDMPMLRRYSIAHTVNTWGRPNADEQVEVAHAVGNFWQLAGQILEKMRKDPSGPGWMQFGIRLQQQHPEVVTDSYLHSMMMAGIVAAHETTANATANALRLLLQHPTAWQEICDDPSLIPNAVEECLRFAGSIVAWRRVALADVRVGGVEIPKGSNVMMIMASGNHDEAHFQDADLLDIHRDNAGDHLSFGYGAHQCMGKNLARLELQVFIEELTRRLPHLRLAAQRFDYVSNIAFRGPEHLWVEWDPSVNPERARPAVLRDLKPVRIGESTRATTGRPLRVARLRRVAEAVVELTLEPLDGRPVGRWAPGAHIDIECGDTGLSRQYSLCGDLEEAGSYRIAVLREPAGRGGSAWVHTRLAEGDVVRVRGPRNHFRFDESVPRAVFIAGGIGITPVSSMAQRARKLGIDYVLHYSGRSRSTMAFVDELRALHGERLVLHVDDEGTRADYAQLRAQVDDATRVYACGPKGLLDALQALATGWPTDALRIERFQTSVGALDPSKEHGFEAELRDSGQVVHVAADQTLLQALRAANIDVPSDCCEGLCGSCEVEVIEGEVDHRDVVLTRAEREQNTKMMSCCSRAVGRKVVLAL
jgi:cytochrome P450/ferredoxin-NADP reductase